MKKGKFNLELAADLTSTEVIAKGDELTAAMRELARIELEKKDVNAIFKQRIEAKETEIVKLREAHEMKREMRSVECIERLNTETKKVETVRLDTGEIVGEPRPLTPDEQQLHMEAVMEGFQRDAKKHEEDAAITTFGATVISEVAQDKPLALAADNPAYDWTEPNNDNAKPKKKKKSGAERIREKKAAAAAAAAEESGTTATKPAKKKAVKKKPAPKADKPKRERKKKPKPVLKSERFDDVGT